jgi:hypothetical protein
MKGILNMSKMITLTLPVTIVNEILNHLWDGVEVWKDTEEYLASGSVVAPCVVAECSRVSKARRMIQLYEETISAIEKVRSSQ